MIRLLFLICLSITIITNTAAQTAVCQEHQCVAVIDAGSTGSRLHIFSYDLDKTATPIKINEIWAKKVNPGFATLPTNEDTLNDYLNTLFANAPADNIPVYFYATAGMRLLPIAKQKAYYQNLNNWFMRNSNWQLREAKTITGDEEALYGWLAVNYHLNKLQSPQTKPIGVLDIGGASVQISFLVDKNNSLSKNPPIELDLYGQHFSLFVHSFLGLGQNEMTHQLLDSTSCFADNYPLPDGQSGEGNASVCAEEIASLINGLHKTNEHVQPTLNNNPVSAWYAIGGISYLAESRPFHFNNNQLTTLDFIQQANQNICHQQWDELNTQFPNNDKIDAFCLLPAFYYALLVKGYGFPPDQIINYLPSEENLDWTLGVVLHPPAFLS